MSAADLLVWASTDSQAQSVARALADAGEEHVDLCRSLDALQSALETQPKVRACLIYHAPVRHLAHSLSKGATLEAAAAEWRAQATAILSAYRKNRTRCSLLECTHLQRFSNAAVSRLKLPNTPTLSFKADPNSSEDILLWNFVARTYLNNTPALYDVAEELIASSVILSNDALLDAPLAAQEAVSALQAQHAKLAHQEARLAQQDAALAEAAVARDLLQQQSTALLAELRATADELAKRTQNLAQQKKAQQNKIAKLEADRDAQVHRLEAEIGRIMGSRSMRLTAPLRRVIELLGRKPDV